MSAVDLDALKIERQATAARPRRRWGVLALGVVVLLVAGSFLLPILRPRTEVRTAPVRLARGEDGATARIGVAEAAGWIEPEPYPVLVRPLVAGVMTELLVLEGHAVKRDETVVARLESAALLARRDRAAADVPLEEAEVRRAEIDLRVAESLLEQKGDLRLAVVEHRRAVAEMTARVEASERELDEADAALASRRAELEAQERLVEGGASYPIALERARAAQAEAEARRGGRKADVRRLQSELAEAQAKLRIAEELRDDPRALAGEVERARTELARRRAKLETARVELRIAQRELDWATVRAPIDGVVMKLLAAPGEVVGPEGHGVVALYDPQRLQARIDVPLASLGGVRVGQEVEIRSEAVPGVVTKGVVLRIQRESDLLKNTTQVKVKLFDPSPLLVPETLCRARFLGGSNEGEAAGPSNVPELFRVPRVAVREAAVFVFDPGDGGRARRVPVERAGDDGDDVIVRGGLSVTQRVILDPVEDGQRVKETNR